MNEEFQATWPEQTALQAVASTAPSASNSVPMKQIVTIRLDVDMLNWFKSGGPGYQTRINQILREHMGAQRAADSEAA